MDLSRLLVGFVPPALAWLSLFTCAGRWLASQGIRDVRVWWMTASTAWGAVLVIITEMAGAFQRFEPFTVGTAWLAVAALGWHGSRRARTDLRPVRQVRDDLNTLWREATAAEKAALATTGAFVWGLLIIGLITPSTNWDSLTYHLPRVMHWIQQHSVAHYPTGNTRQLEFGPWCGFSLATFHLLQGTDRLANFTQWFALLTTLVAVSRLATQLEALLRAAHAPRRGMAPALLAPLLVVTLPIGVVESITTQTDYAVACWYVLFLSFGLDLLREPAAPRHQISCALALALGLLTKATMFIFVAPAAVVWCFWWCFRLPNWRGRGAWLLWFLALTLLLNAGHWSRNLKLFGSPLGSPHIFALERNARFSAGTFASNVWRNFALHLNTGFLPVNRQLNRLWQQAHAWTGQDLQDPDTTYRVGEFGLRDHSVVFDSYASNFYHLVLFAAAAIIGLARFRRAPVFWYAAVVLASFFLFCVYVRWSFWHARIHLAYLAALAPWAAVFLARGLRPWLLAGGSVLLVWFALFSLATNRSRPILNRAFMSAPREVQTLWVYQPLTLEPLDQCARDLVASDCRTIGLQLGFDDAEYPLWLWLRRAGFAGTLRHWNMTNESARLDPASARPCAVIASMTNLAFAAQAWAPHKIDYGELSVFWTDAKSHWADLSYFTPEVVGLRPVPHQPVELRFERRILTLYARVPRGGRLTLRGTLSPPAHVAAAEIGVRTDRGSSATWSCVSGKIEGSLRLMPGRTKITVVLPEMPMATGESRWLRLIEWQWQPMETE